jgi:hypothetical protein
MRIQTHPRTGRRKHSRSPPRAVQSVQQAQPQAHPNPAKAVQTGCRRAGPLAPNRPGQVRRTTVRAQHRWLPLAIRLPTRTADLRAYPQPLSGYAPRLPCAAAGSVCLSASAVARLVILTSRGELEDRMAVRLSDEVLYRGILGCLEVRPRGRGDADVSPEDGPGLLRGGLADGVVAGVAGRGSGVPARPRGRCAPRKPAHRGRPASAARRAPPGPRGWYAADRSCGHGWSAGRSGALGPRGRARS